MTPQDDPEARIRALEQPLSDMARASELGNDNRYDAYGYPPALPPPPTPPTQQWPYAANPYPGGYSTGFPTAPNRSGFRPWMLFVPIAIVFLAVAGGVVAWTMFQSTSVIGNAPGISGGGGLITDAPPGLGVSGQRGKPGPSVDARRSIATAVVPPRVPALSVRCGE